MSKTDGEIADTSQDLPNALFRQLVEQSSDVTIILSSTGFLRYVSPAVFSVFGFRPESATLSKFLHWFYPQDRHVISQFLRASLPTPRRILTRLRHHRGHWIDCSVLFQSLSVHPVERLERPGDSMHWYFMSLRPQDLTMVHYRQSADEVARENEQTKSNFLAIMSHELRTPINAINGFSQLLLRQRRDRLTPEQENMVERILTNGKNLLNLINNVLDLSKLEAGRMQLHLEEVNVADLIEGTIQGISSLATENNLTVNTECYLTDPVITNDALRLRQILVNLLSNAIKFSDGGQVWVVVEDCDVSKLRISVSGHRPRDRL